MSVTGAWKDTNGGCLLAHQSSKMFHLKSYADLVDGALARWIVVITSGVKPHALRGQTCV